MLDPATPVKGGHPNKVQRFTHKVQIFILQARVSLEPSGVPAKMIQANTFRVILLCTCPVGWCLKVFNN